MHWRLALFVFVMMFSCGCGKPESNGTAQGNAIAEECKSFLNVPTSAKGRAELDRKIKVAVQAASDWHVRGEIVRSMVAELLGADLSLHGGDYQDMSRRVSAYENCFECVVHWLFDSGLEGQYVMGSFFVCMGKLRSACFSVPQTGRLQGESEMEFEKRCYAVWNMMEDYGHAMRLWDLSYDKHLQVLPAELHGEYMERRKKFMAYSSGRKLREEMLFNSK